MTQVAQVSLSLSKSLNLSVMIMSIHVTLLYELFDIQLECYLLMSEWVSGLQ